MANLPQIIKFWFFYILLGCEAIESVMLPARIADERFPLLNQGLWPSKEVSASSSDFNPIPADQYPSLTSHQNNLEAQDTQNTPPHPIQARISGTSSFQTTVHPPLEGLQAQGVLPHRADPIPGTETLPDSDWLWDFQSVDQKKLRELISVQTDQKRLKEQTENIQRGTVFSHFYLG
ncbi:hypothetical protein CROQUDRAFT_658829 [Cronartium quercuum f. sp. fusiforme G11]|uniref:Uncharacterized protein n=1 Tax=Cronartium quercuum f. sp. fusiforme G11 TaxID=708437 RepID=A0A9P6TB42_9BASI|nr:hypothetical protein CROQUDRAFT_658829 [Cronartium quercuum f. sp. fusiforme G11]